MVNNSISIGKRGEDIACEYLINKGYKILYRNYREGSDEIDIISKENDGTLVFFEVKTFVDKHLNIETLAPEDNLNHSKLEKIKRGCQMFVGKHSNLIDDNKGWRIDALALTLSEKDYVISHYKNI